MKHVFGGPEREGREKGEGEGGGEGGGRLRERNRVSFLFFCFFLLPLSESDSERKEVDSLLLQASSLAKNSTTIPLLAKLSEREMHE